MTAQEQLHRLVDTLSEKEAEHLLEYLHRRMDKAEIQEAIDEMVEEGSPVPPVQAGTTNSPAGVS